MKIKMFMEIFLNFHLVSYINLYILNIMTTAVVGTLKNTDTKGCWYARKDED